jgi:signal transduction histidine kinase
VTARAGGRAAGTVTASPVPSSDNDPVTTVAPDPARIAAAVLRAPFTARARRELLFCLVALGSGLVVLAVVALALAPGTAESAIRGGFLLTVLVLGLVATGGARRLGARFRGLTARLLGEAVAAPAPRVQAARPGPRRLLAGLRDGPSWRALLYLVLRVPVAALHLYVFSFWFGAVDMTYPFWWRLFRNHPPGTTLRPVPLQTPVGAFDIRTYPGTFLAFAVGAVLLLAAPWVTRAVTALERWLARTLLGPGRGLAERVRSLEETRSHVLDDSAATLRRIERDLHDGTQAQLATLAMNLGQAKERLQHDAEVPFDPAAALELVDAAHHQAKEALVELRNIARGIHPPALDLGLDAALATLVARSAVPAVLTIDLPERPTPAIEAIAYFSAAELLANVARHSGAARATVDVAAGDGRLQLTVTDDGVGGAGAAAGEGGGTGLRGLADRVHAVDGRLDVDSPPGGPTVVTVELPLQV